MIWICDTDVSNGKCEADVAPMKSSTKPKTIFHCPTARR